MRTLVPDRTRPSRVRSEVSARTGGAILVARFAAGAVLNYAFGLGMAWLLVPEDFGIVSAIQNVLLLAAGLLNAGLPWALAIRVAKTPDNPEAAKPEFRTALIANLGFGLFLAALFMTTQLAGPRLVPASSLGLDLTVAAEMVLLAVNSILAGAAQGSRRFAGLGAMQAGEIMLKCAAAAVIVAALHGGPLGVALSFLIGTAGSVLIGLRTCLGLLPGWGPLASLGFLADSGSIWFASAAVTFLITADLLGLEAAGQAAGVTAAVLAGYQACSLLARASFYVSDALADAVFPFIAKAGSPGERHRWFLSAARWVPLLIIPVQAALFAAPGPVLRVFLPDAYSSPQAHALLRVLAAGTVGALMTDMLVKALFAAGRGRQVARQMPIAVATEITGLVILVPRYGALGAAFSYLLASAVSVILLAPLYLKVVQVRPAISPKTFLYVLGFAPTAAIFAVAGRAPTLIAWVLIAAGTLVFVLPARRMGLITDADVSVLNGLRPGGPGRRAPWRADACLAVFCACVAAGALLYNIFTSPDILYDEAAYTFAAQQVAQGWRLTIDTQPMFVHPPLMFLLQAAWLHLTGRAYAPVASAIRAARLLAASVGAVNVLLIASLAFGLTAWAGPRRRRVITGAVAVIAALDPVLVRYGRQDVIEPFALCVSLLTLHAAWRLRDRGTLTYVCVTGLLGGLALLTNEITICLVAVPPLFALLERDRLLLRRALGALGIAIGFLGLFLVWAAELGLAGDFVNIQTTTLRRMIGLVQITGLNVPGTSLTGAVVRSIGQYSSSYIVLAVGFTALLWCWGRRNTTTQANFLTAWLTASHFVGAYIVAVGTLNEQFFVYLLPASIVGSVLLADAVVASGARRALRSRIRHGRQRERVSRRLFALGPVFAVVGGGLAVVGLSAFGWVTNYTGAGDGVVLADRFIATTLPACAVVNATGDAEKYSYLLPSRQFGYFTEGAAALAYGVHYFLLSSVDAAERSGDMSPELAHWIATHGRRLAVFPSRTYQGVQLWQVPASPYDPLADVTDIAGGVYVNTVSSACGGYTVTNSPGADFYSVYQAHGGKRILGDPLSRPTAFGPGRREQFFDGMVLAESQSDPSAIRPLPIVAMLATRAPAAYRRGHLPPVRAHFTIAQEHRWLTNASITRAWLGGKRMTATSYAAAVRRYGAPLGPAVALPGGMVGQAFADVVLEAPRAGGSVRAAAATTVAVKAGLLHVPAGARAPQRPPPLPDPLAPGPPAPASAEPFTVTFAVALALYATAVAILARRRRRGAS